MPLCGPLAQVDGMGAGVGLHFRVLWHLAAYFAITTVFAIPCFVMAYWGSR